ncbi:ABC transporter ATP-binding protein [Moraxella catarrhalis]|uniref:ABC transporter ATP-binding protein n=1 Tax=Moraxella catarrhalis TaxID=480 RepID=UPI000202A8F9|nr:ABC transporter ATP-binding protein [Moraxella catarrhalis]EGE26018.1 ABC transporter ATPase subunit [Moraxella catarrhalis O35E]MPW59162.1 ABC transporter ATP-binding protein [Moraxella catarrhalis]MPW89828.1 ABC transporter ATP-binding protein [Moraxella catarrhalis]
MHPKLEFKNISHAFTTNAKTPLFDGLNLKVAQGSVVSIVGASGVGKSTLFNIAAGLIYPSHGQVMIDGKNVTGTSGYVGYMLQKDLLLPYKTVYDNIALPLMLSHKTKQEIAAQIQPNLTIFGLDGLTKKYPNQLSGGQRQRVALLRTYLSNRELMLLDEPFSALDFVTKADMHEWFGQFRQANQLTCLIITHDIDEAIYLSDEVYVLKGMPAMFTHHFWVPKQQDFYQSTEYLTLKQQILTAIRY